MRVDVIAMTEKNTQPVIGWAFRPDRKGELRAVYPNRSSQSPEKSWTDLALKINQRAVRGEHTPVEVFLYLRDGLPASVYEYGTLGKIVAGALDHAWAGRLYVVWDSLPVNSLERAFGTESARILLAKCFSAFLQGRVTDLIEINRWGRPPRQPNAEEERQILRGYAASSQKRWEALRAFAGDAPWGYVLRKDARTLEAFLSELVREGCFPPSGSSHLIIFDAAPEFGPKELLDEFKRVNSTGRGLVAATPEGYSKDLYYQCERESQPLQVLMFNGVFEAAYALSQLNTAAKTEAGRDHFNVAPEVEIETVEVAGSPLFQAPAKQSRPSLLITSAFHPGEESAHSAAAAREIGTMLRGLPFHLDLVVHPCVTCESLPDLLESGGFTAWVHLSHGNRACGLYEPQLKGYASPQRWLTCFTVYKSSLKLVVFSSCESACVARLFAGAGVGVAVGFRSEVLVQATKIMVQKVVRAAVREDGDEEAILEAYRDACNSLAARTYAERGNDVGYDAARPVAFRSFRK